MSNVTSVGTRNFTSEIKNSSRLTVVLFRASWEDNCKKMLTSLPNVARRFGGKVKFAEINIDENTDLAAEYGIMHIPNLLFFENGQVVNQIIGLLSEKELYNHVSRALETPSYTEDAFSPSSPSRPMFNDVDSLADYLKDVIDEVSPPIDTMLWAVWEPGQEHPNAADNVAFMFRIIGWHLIFSHQANSSISDAKLAHIRKLLFEIDPFNEMADMLPHHYLAMVQQVGSDNSLVSNLDIGELAPLVGLQIHDEQNHTDYSDKIKTAFLLFAESVASSGKGPTAQDKRLIEKLRQKLDISDPISPSTGDVVPINAIVGQIVSGKAGSEVSDSQQLSKSDEPETLDELLTELNKLIGLDSVKADVLNLVNFLKVQQMRQSKGLAVIPMSRHLVFYGNPGTGKTTMARLLARIYKSLGILSRGQLVETDRSGMVAGYVGQTALKVREVVQEAIGGVLFIDEAYALGSQQGQDFGQEAIDTLLKLMEDNRDDLIVIVAGYTGKMKTFLASNPGLRSRFNKYFSFADYDSLQLVEIFELFCTEAGFDVAASAREKVLGLFGALYERRDETFGNARLARNVFEQTMQRHSNRIVALAEIDESALSMIEAEDIPREFDDNI